MSTIIKPAELRPADILLYQGTEFPIDTLIRVFDGSEYSHSSIYDGSKVLEAIATGIADRVEFLRTLGQACLKTGWRLPIG